ncbi:hypothetical protein KUCAC02_003987 [Chaenocephalus aceratus]|uniref:Uncharacterized protein n=1 Tax=Chaenocephalus aceratus TaxID=36190 RepID=A0ACB9WXW3_CHAAC|nr:hypothetical protein KUCAC02_003987 [Chaenocephalus aceratus]
MAAPGRHVGHYIQRNSRVLLNNFEQLWSHRNFGWTSALRQQAAEANKEPTDTIVIPRKKTWSKEAVLEALSSTVGRDPTAYPYNFQDDPFLSPRTVNEFKLYSLSKESGRSAAKFFINNNPKYFTTDFAEPHIPEEPGEEVRQGRGRPRRASDFMKFSWKENNNAERIFNLLPERDTRCYSALIRGMVKHGAHAKAFSIYTDLLNNRLTADVHIFNALLIAAPDLRDKYNERWDLLAELLNQMSQQKVQPNLSTFNSVLKALRRCGSLAKTQAIHTLNEMKAMGIAPSLASYDHILNAFSKAASSSGAVNTDILQEVMSELEGRSFTCQDPDDVLFFSTAMRICVNNKDLELGYRCITWWSTGRTGGCWDLSTSRVPSSNCTNPNPQGLKDLLQALDTDSRLDLLPIIWKDICALGQDNKADLVEELLMLMARDKHSPGGVRSVCSGHKDYVGGRQEEEPVWSGAPPPLSNITSLQLRANKTREAWETLKLFKSKNRVPKEPLLEDFLAVLSELESTGESSG